MDRIGWDEYFMRMAEVAKERSTCIRRQVGAILVKDNFIISTGYNGAPSGLPHASEVGCLRTTMNVPSGSNHEICRGVHAEQNAIIQAAVHGVSTDGAVVYCTNKPCSICTKMLINARISRIVYLDGYEDLLADELLKETSIEIVKHTR